MNSNEVNLQNFLYTNVKSGNWEEVIKKCGEEIKGLSLRLTQPWDTVLHLAAYDTKVEVVEKLVELIRKFQNKEILKIKNERGNTPLHVAAIMGCARMCNIIGSVNKKLVDERNIDGETPLFLAAVYDHKMAFYSLYDFCRTNLGRVRTNCRRKNGDTILHCAIKNEKFDLAFQILNMNKDAATWVDQQGHNPLQTLATKPSAFRSGAHFSRWKHIVYYCICVPQLKADSAPTYFQSCKGKSTKQITAASLPKNYATCIHLVTNLWKGFLLFIDNLKFIKFNRKENQDPFNNDEDKDTDLEKDDRDENEIIETHESHPRLDSQVLLKRPGGHQSETKPPSSIFPQNYDTCINFSQIVIMLIMILMGIGFASVRKIEKKKRKHTWSVQVMEKLLELTPPDKYDQNGDTPINILSNLESGETRPYSFHGDSIEFNDRMITQSKNNKPENKEKHIRRKETAMLLAAKNGVVEMVSRLFEHFPLAVRDSNSEKKNVVLLAAEYRQPNVYKYLLNKRLQLETLFRAVDNNGNSALHLAAHLKTHKTWRITGAALQMQWEVKWYRYVRNSVEPHFFVQYNNDGKLARNIFYDTHNELGKKGGEWLINTSESCSVVAALIVTVAYASATTVPGGNGDDGTPPFEKERGFFIFALTSLIALCLSTTSVIMFLAILTSRFDEKDFGSKLPLRLFIGLSSLFFSIVAMLVSFCAGHYFLLSYYLQNMAVVIYIATSIPVVLVFVIVQLPLYCDLVFAIFSKTPKRSNDVIVIDDPTSLNERENPRNVEGDGKTILSGKSKN